MTTTPTPNMPIAQIWLNLIQRCPACCAALDGPHHADSGRPDCGWDNE